jgi:hypothetical protein
MLDKAIIEVHCPHWLEYENPCTQVDGSLYGLPRGDVDWGLKARKVLIEIGMQHVVDIGEDSVYLQFEPDFPRPVLTVVYNDDFALGGEETPTRRVHDALQQRLGFGKMKDYRLLDYIGLERLVVPPVVPGTHRVILHQSAYAEMVVSEYEAEHNHGQRLRSISTPCRDNEFDNLPVPVWVPHLKLWAMHYNGQIWWLARGTRPELCIAAHRIASRFTVWERADDWLLHRIMQYLRGHISFGLEFVGKPSERDSLQLTMFVDSDHLNDTVIEKSTSGVFVELTSTVSKLPIDFGMKRQGSTSRHTAEAETNALDYGTHMYGLPHSLFWSQLLQRKLCLTAMEDNDACIRAVLKGFSRKMAYLPSKTDRVSIASLHEVYHGDTLVVDKTSPHNLTKVASADQKADIFTKPLDATTHWRMCELIGVVPLP